MAKQLELKSGVGVCAALVACLLGTAAVSVSVGEAKKQEESKKADKPVAGKADVLRDVPKKFAVLESYDPQSRRVKLLVEGDKAPKEWPVLADAEVKRHGWWGRVEQIPLGHRVWVWWAVDRKKNPTSVLMLADELSEQDIHNLPYKITAIDAEKRWVTLRRGDETRTLKIAEGTTFNKKVGETVFVQTAGDRIAKIVDSEGVEAQRRRQQAAMRGLWKKEGLPGTVSFLHPLAGEMEVMLDHEAKRWARYLEPGARVTLESDEPIQATVKQVSPWRERTELRLVSDTGRDQAVLSIGQRLRVAVPEPPEEVQSSTLPTDLGRPRSREERVGWFLANTYCTCSVNKDVCTGMFYTLASCNVNGCGMPNQLRKMVEEMIDKGMTDREILGELREKRGPNLLKPHLLK